MGYGVKWDTNILINTDIFFFDLIRYKIMNIYKTSRIMSNNQKRFFKKRLKTTSSQLNT